MHIHQHKCICIENVLTVFSDNKIDETARVSVFGMACGGESTSTAVDNCSRSPITAVMISSYFLSGSFNPWAGCLEDSIRHD